MREGIIQLIGMNTKAIADLKKEPQNAGVAEAMIRGGARSSIRTLEWQNYELNKILDAEDERERKKIDELMQADRRI